LLLLLAQNIVLVVVVGRIPLLSATFAEARELWGAQLGKSGRLPGIGCLLLSAAGNGVSEGKGWCKHLTHLLAHLLHLVVHATPKLLLVLLHGLQMSLHLGLLCLGGLTCGAAILGDEAVLKRKLSFRIDYSARFVFTNSFGS
jgi:hypothetical protein